MWKMNYKSIHPCANHCLRHYVACAFFMVNELHQLVENENAFNLSIAYTNIITMNGFPDYLVKAMFKHCEQLKTVYQDGHQKCIPIEKILDMHFAYLLSYFIQSETKQSSLKHVVTFFCNKVLLSNQVPSENDAEPEKWLLKRMNEAFMNFGKCNYKRIQIRKTLYFNIVLETMFIFCIANPAMLFSNAIVSISHFTTASMMILVQLAFQLVKDAICTSESTTINTSQLFVFVHKYNRAPPKLWRLVSQPKSV